MASNLAPFLADGHRCTSYCRGLRHATVIWLGTEEQAAPERTLRAVCQREGVRYIVAEPAPEARPLPLTSTLNLGTNAVYTVPTLAAEDVAWLLVWELIWEDTDGD